MRTYLVNSIHKTPQAQTQVLLSKIDDYLIRTATRRRDEIRLGERSSMNYDTYQLLLLLRKILLGKSCSDSCHECVSFDDIALATNKILYNVC